MFLRGVKRYVKFDHIKNEEIRNELRVLSLEVD